MDLLEKAFDVFVLIKMEIQMDSLEMIGKVTKTLTENLYNFFFKPS